MTQLTGDQGVRCDGCGTVRPWWTKEEHGLRAADGILGALRLMIGRQS